MVIILVIIALPVLFYIPAVQNFAKDIAVKEVRKSTGLDIVIDRLRIRYPLRVELDDVTVIEPQALDTMLQAKRLAVDVAVLPLLRLDIQASGLEGDDLRYQMGTPDSVLYLRAAVDRVSLNDGSVDLRRGRIDVDRAAVDGARVRLVMRPDSVATPVDTAKAVQWVIKAREIDLRRVEYSMQMEPIIDSLAASVPYASLRDGIVDMTKREISARYLAVDSVSAAYFYPSPQFVAAHPELSIEPPVEPTSPADMWSIRADSLRLTGRRALYAMTGAVPQPGLDMNWLEAKDIDIAVDNFFNRGMVISVPVKRLAATERCGLALDASGLFAMDSTAMTLKDFIVDTGRSRLTVDRGVLGVGDLMTDPSLPIALTASATVAPQDILLAFPAMRPMLAPTVGRGVIALDADLEGSPASLRVDRLALNALRILKLNASGTLTDVTDANRAGGSLKLDGSLTDGSLLARILPKGTIPEGLNIPSLALNGDVTYHPGRASGALRATTAGGRVALDGQWTANSETYDAHLDIADFPVDAFMPSLGVGRVTATLVAKGRGYNPMALSTSMDVDLDVKSVTFNGQEITYVRLTALTGGGHAKGLLSSSNPAASLDLDFDATMTPEAYTWTLNGDVRRLDLKELRLTPDACGGSLAIASVGTYDPRDGSIDGSLTVNNLSWDLAEMSLKTPSATATLAATPHAVNATLSNGDLGLHLASTVPLDTLLTRFSGLTAVVDTIMTRHRADIQALQAALPPFEMAGHLGSDNLVASILTERGMALDHANMAVRNDTLLTLGANLYGFASGSTTLDTIAFSAYQRQKTLVFNALLNNRPGTMDNFAHVRLNGFLADNRLSVFLNERNIDLDEGFNLGLLVTTTDSLMTARLVPAHPVIAYRKFDLNTDNYLTYNIFNHHIHADVSLSDGNTSLRLYTIENGDDDSETPDDLVAQIRNLQLADYLTISPFAPPIKGLASGDVRLHYDGTLLTGNGNVSLTDFYYDRRRVGSFDADLRVATSPATGLLTADMNLAVDSARVMTLHGVLNDSTATTPMRLDLNVDRFPLAVANPFIPSDVASIAGSLSGAMQVTGTPSAPVLDGYLAFDSTAVKVAMLGTPLRFSNERIPVRNSLVLFDDFTISAANDNPLTVNGKVDLTHLMNVGVDLNLYANDFMVVNSTRPRGADVYGKAYLDINANVRGNMDFMRAEASVNLLSGSNVYYVLSSAASSAITAPGSQDMVHFVSFADSTAVALADTLQRAPMALLLEAQLTVSPGTTINVDLSTSNNDRVSIQGNGTLNYTQSPINSGRLTGRFNINGGYVKYTPPAIISEKTFTFNDGSYVAFNGDMLNPTLNIHAVDRMKANVTRSGENSRLVNFDVEVGVTGTLETMNVAFDLSTDDDITVSNELAAMSPDQRANQAMNLLLYGVYSANGTNGNANLGGNILYTFVESTLNNWMANNVKFVDISFGIDQYDKTYNGATTTATNYSYHVSKTLFNDRFKIVVGGTYSTDNEGSDESVAESLINDISAEYLLNRAGTMYVRIFRHTGYESILEGEVTQTGVGFVYKRRMLSLADFFRRQKGNIVPPHPAHQEK